MFCLVQPCNVNRRLVSPAIWEGLNSVRFYFFPTYFVRPDRGFSSSFPFINRPRWETSKGKLFLPSTIPSKERNSGKIFVIYGFLPCVSTLACVESVSVRFRSKERGTRTKDRAKNGASKRAGRDRGRKVSFLPSPPPPPSFIFWLSFHFSRGQNRKSPSSLFFCSETKRKRLLRRLLAHKPLVKHVIRTTCTRSINEPYSRET